MNDSINPLRKYFRHPEIHLRLPSGGRFYPDGTITLPPTGELPIYPMTAVDEIISRTPDALFNGSALTSIVASCAPDIKDPWSIPAMDVSALLAAIRLASYGHEMDISTTCPSCFSEQEFSADLRVVLDTLKAADYSQPLMLGDLSISFMPLSYKQLNDMNRVNFDDQLMLKSISESDLEDQDKVAKISEAYKRITMVTVRSIAASINSIKTSDALVTDIDQIYEFLTNCTKANYEAIRNKVVELRASTDFKPFDMKCQECGFEYKQEFALDMSNFFATAS